MSGKKVFIFEQHRIFGILMVFISPMLVMLTLVADSITLNLGGAPVDTLLSFKLN